MREQFHRAAVTDPLTGIANRRRLMDELEHRTGAPYRLLMLDADGLKQVNDSLGYEDGDLLIVALADTLASVLEAGELAARLGGDELVGCPERALARRRVGPRAPPARCSSTTCRSPAGSATSATGRASAAWRRAPARRRARRSGAPAPRCSGTSAAASPTGASRAHGHRGARLRGGELRPLGADGPLKLGLRHR